MMKKTAEILYIISLLMLVIIAIYKLQTQEK